jgi:quercetin dioxygenase-like cupin family protein
MTRIGRGIGTVGVIAALALPAASRGQDAAVVNSRTVHVTLDNERVRVFEAVLPPGEKEQMHSHPASLVYVIDGGKVRNHTPDGKVTEAELHPGDTAYREPVTHWAENVGTTTIRLVVVELKSPR